MGCLFKLKYNNCSTFYCTPTSDSEDYIQFLNFIKLYVNLQDTNKDYYILNPLGIPKDTPKGLKLIRTENLIKRLGWELSGFSTSFHKDYYFIELKNMPRVKATPVLHDIEVIRHYYDMFSGDRRVIYHISLHDIFKIWNFLEHKTIPERVLKILYK